jgi:hypothetical protein
LRESVSAQKSIHMVDMAKRPPERHRKVPPVTINDIQKTTNDNLEATRHSFEHATTSFGGATRVTQEIAKQIADYSKHSFEQGSKTLEKAAHGEVARQSVRGADRIRESGLRKLR